MAPGMRSGRSDERSVSETSHVVLYLALGDIVNFRVQAILDLASV